MSKVYNFHCTVTDLTDPSIGENAYEYFIDDGFGAKLSCNVVADNFDIAKSLAVKYMTTPMMNVIESVAIDLVSQLINALPTAATTTIEVEDNAVKHKIQISAKASIVDRNTVL